MNALLRRRPLQIAGLALRTCMGYWGIASIQSYAIAAGDSAEHRAIQEELRRREINSALDTETCLLFTAEQWSRTLKRVTLTTRERTKFAV
jgi:hypothetical protein